MRNLIAHGAEAKLYREGGFLIKERIKKPYRIRQLDKMLRKRRTRQELRLMREARRTGVRTPQIADESDYTIKMAFVGGKKVKDVLDEENYKAVCKKIGESIAKLHSCDIIHGDLTTSNMLLYDEIYFIDFGLGFHSQRTEDKAVDIGLLKQALRSTHFGIMQKAWDAVLEGYKAYKDSGKVIKALHKIEKRGRYKK